jgi:dihydrofolate synthase / folylpolyglutamate synthase
MTEGATSPGSVPPMRQVFVAGSVGKTSIGTMTAALIHACGARVAHLSDSYLHSPLERLTLDGRPLERDFFETLRQPNPADEPGPVSDIDVLLERAILTSHASWLVRSGASPPSGSVDLAVIGPILPTVERGAGEVATEFLDAMPQPAGAVCSPQRESALDVLRPRLSNMQEVAQSCRLSRGRAGLEEQEFRLQTPQSEYRLKLPVLGPFQVENAATAVLAVEALRPQGVELTPELATAAFAAIRLPGRLEVIKRHPLVIVDTCTSSAALRRVIEGLRELVAQRRLQALLDCSAGLDPAELVRLLEPLRAEIVAIAPASTGAAREQFTAAASEAGLPLRYAPDMTAAIDQSLSAAQDGDAIVALGSRFSIDSVRSLLLGLMPDNLSLN